MHYSRNDEHPSLTTTNYYYLLRILFSHPHTGNIVIRTNIEKHRVTTTSPPRVSSSALVLTTFRERIIRISHERYRGFTSNLPLFPPPFSLASCRAATTLFFLPESVADRDSIVFLSLRSFRRFLHPRLLLLSACKPRIAGGKKRLDTLIAMTLFFSSARASWKSAILSTL